MYLIDVIAFAENYGLAAMIISVTVAVCCLIIDKFFADKMCLTVKTYAPFIISVALNFIADAIFFKNGLSFWEDTVYSGILCGSVATAIFACFKRAGKDVKNLLKKPDLSIVIAEYLQGYIEKESISPAAEEIANFLVNNGSENPEQKIAEIISRYAISSVNDGEIKALAALIVKSAETLFSVSEKK